MNGELLIIFVYSILIQDKRRSSESTPDFFEKTLYVLHLKSFANEKYFHNNTFYQ